MKIGFRVTDGNPDDDSAASYLTVKSPFTLGELLSNVVRNLNEGETLIVWKQVNGSESETPGQATTL